jgi:hypothetical protein
MEFADHLCLTLDLEAPRHMVVLWPRVSDTLGPFTVRGQRLTGPLTTTSHSRKWQQEYVLAAESTGTLTIPPLTVAVQAAGAGPVAPLQQLSTEALAIVVMPLLPADADVTTPQDIAPPVLLVRPGLPLWAWVTAGVLGSLGLLVGVWWYQRRWPTGRAMPPPPAHVLALQALEQLWREDLIAQQRVEEFHVRLSAILRHYVAGRFGLRALQQTTEEVLLALRTTGACLVAYHSLLDTCLRHCDLVKFARHQPTPDAMRQAWERARGFIEQTAVAEASSPVDGLQG